MYLVQTGCSKCGKPVEEIEKKLKQDGLKETSPRGIIVYIARAKTKNDVKIYEPKRETN
jgi:hypothetical protein